MSNYKPKFLNTPISKQRSKKGRTPESVGLSPELEKELRAQNKRINMFDKTQALIENENWILGRVNMYRFLTKPELKSLGIERRVRFADRVTPETIIFLLAEQDIECQQKGGDLKELKTYPSKIIVYVISKELEKMMTEKAKKAIKSRIKAGRSEATETLFDKMVELYPDFLSKQDDPRYSLSRTKKLDAEILTELDIDLGTYNLNNYTFYATERQVEGDQEIFLRFMKGKEVPEFAENEDSGKFTGTAEQCMTRFKRWAKKLGIPQLNKAYATKKVEAVEKKSAAKKVAAEETKPDEKATKKVATAETDEISAKEIKKRKKFKKNYNNK